MQFHVDFKGIGHPKKKIDLPSWSKPVWLLWNTKGEILITDFFFFLHANMGNALTPPHPRFKHSVNNNVSKQYW